MLFGQRDESERGRRILDVVKRFYLIDLANTWVNFGVYVWNVHMWVDLSVPQVEGCAF